jgi:cytochrome c-type biogenesis protein
VWGVLSIVLSPCHLSSIPLIVGFITGQGRTTTRRAFGVAMVFAVGILITIAAVGAITAAAGRMMGDVGRWGNYLVAVVFFAVGPCTFTYMAPMLGVTFKMASAHPIYGASLLLAYGVGHCAVIVLAGTFTEVVQRYLNWNEQFKGVKVLKVACGVLVLLGGGYLIYTAH